MRIAVAPDSFKGCMTALEAAVAIEKGIKRACPEWEVVKVAIVGALGKDALKVNEAGIEAYFGSLERPLTEMELKLEGPRALTDCAEQVARMLRLGMGMGMKG